MDPGLLLLAFTAGMVAFFAPCCVAMLPAYVGYAVRQNPTEAEMALASSQRSRSLLRWAGLAVDFMGVAVFFVGAWPLLQIALAAVGLASSTSTNIHADQDAALVVLLGIALVVLGIALAGRLGRVRRGLRMGVLATLGFLTVFLAVGLPIALVARFLVPFVPVLAVVIGITLSVVGLGMLLGIAPRLTLSFRTASLDGPRGYYLFGVGYGAASMSCTFPVFLSVVGIGLISGGVADGLTAFAAYALGKGALLTGVAVMAAGVGTSGKGRLNRITPYVHKASGLLMLAAGAYIAWYFGKAVWT